MLAAPNVQLEVLFDAHTTTSKSASTLAPTTASSIVPGKLGAAENLESTDMLKDNDNQSQISYATSIGAGDSKSRLTVVPLEDVAGTAEDFECPYCWTIQRISNQNAWR